jgi:F0F1-type ATP synthase assembly protein I
VIQDDQINQTAMLASIVGQIGCITVIIIALALGGGIFLDRYLDTRPIFTILFLVGSVPITLFITVRVSLMAASRAQKMEAARKPKQAAEEEASK